MVWPLGVVMARSNWPIMLPFVILLLAIAFGPVIAQHHWQSHYHRLCVALAGIVSALRHSGKLAGSFSEFSER